MAEPEALAPRIVLVRTQHGGNVGASARAMANMGLSELVLVAPQMRREREALAMACGASGILERARTCTTLAEAVSDCTTVVACTARPRRWKAWKLLGPAEVGTLLMERGSAGEATALLFGAEDRGLLQSELEHASHICHIPTGQEQSSLNLSQAVLLLCWEYAKARGDLRCRPGPSRRRQAPGMDQVCGAADQIGCLLDRIDFFRGRNRDQSLATIRQVLLRGEMTETEVHFLRGVVGKLRWYVDHGPRVAEVAPRGGEDAPQGESSPDSE